MSDTTLNQFISRGTNAQRVAFTPSPATPASGNNPSYIFYETDTTNTYMWDGSAWQKINTGGGTSGPIPAGLGGWEGMDHEEAIIPVPGVFDTGSPGLVPPSGGGTTKFLRADRSWQVPPAISSGTSFPGSPSTNDQFYRTDRNFAYYYDGTRWLTQELFHTTIMLTQAGISGSLNIAAIPVWFGGVYDVYVVDFVLTTELLATANYTFDLYSFDSSTFVALFTTGTFGTNGDSASVYVNRRQSINTAVSNTIDGFQINITKVSGTATLFGGCGITARMIG